MGQSRKKECKTLSRKARHCLLSICEDVDHFLKNVIDCFHSSSSQEWNGVACQGAWPVVSNERCGTWYAHPYASMSCHFKSTDGHKDTWNFSLKRLNLSFLNRAVTSGGVLVVDASKSKPMPDSFSRTMPIWCAVLNRVAFIYRDRLGSDFGHDVNVDVEWDNDLYTPCCISMSEHETIANLLDERVQTVMESGVIINPLWLVQNLSKPLRCFWITNPGPGVQHHNPNDLETVFANVQEAQSRYTCIVCISCSRGSDDGILWREWDGGYWYTPGAADDHEAWAGGLTSSLFWAHKNAILHDCNTDEETDAAIQTLVETAKHCDEEWYLGVESVGKAAGEIINPSNAVNKTLTISFDTLGTSGISIGTRRAGRPPQCWDHFDAIINVTMMEYDDLASGKAIPSGKHYLQMPVKEGKRDRSELEKWMAVAMVFILTHGAVKGKRILVHCAQGKDRSVAVVMAAICLFCDLVSNNHGNSKGNLKFYPWCSKMTVESLHAFGRDNGIITDDSTCNGQFGSSGLSQHIVDALTGREGRNLLFSWIRSVSSTGTENQTEMVSQKIEETSEYSKLEPLATKESLRLSLHIIQAFRDKACPTRNTMQKLNRFFMSSDYE